MNVPFNYSIEESNLDLSKQKYLDANAIKHFRYYPRALRRQVISYVSSLSDPISCSFKY